jgi:thioesterase domain-containing protein
MDLRRRRRYRLPDRRTQQERTMTPQALEQYLHAHIPLSQAMQVGVAAIEPDRIVLSAPLAPNINHRETLFGGSASAIAILAAWSLLHVRLRDEGMTTKLVIQRNTMRYEAPIAGDFTAIARLPAPSDWDAFKRTLIRRGKARIGVLSELHYAGQVAGRLEGEFVALGVDPL